MGDVLRDMFSEEEEDDFWLEVVLFFEKIDGLGSGDEKKMERVSEFCLGFKK